MQSWPSTSAFLVTRGDAACASAGAAVVSIASIAGKEGTPRLMFRRQSRHHCVARRSAKGVADGSGWCVAPGVVGRRCSINCPSPRS
jgi:hypothetical protein